jgi:hypothetical protein
LRIIRRAWTGAWSFADDGSSSKAMTPVRGGCKLGSGNRLVQSGPCSPFDRILSKRYVRYHEGEQNALRTSAMTTRIPRGPTLRCLRRARLLRKDRHDTQRQIHPQEAILGTISQKIRITTKSRYLTQHLLHPRPENTRAP